VRQSFNAVDIWREHQKENVGSVNLELEQHQLVIWRGSDDSILIRRVSEALSALIGYSQKGRAFSDAMIAASESTEDMHKFQQEFAKAMSLGLFVQTGKEISHD
jgi:hypothetical protein